MDNESHSQRTSRQRTVILEELQKVLDHPTADEVYRRVRRRLPRISLGTVYRNLDLLCKQGVAQKVESGKSQCRFDAITETHCHVRCVDCDAVDDALGAPPAVDEGMFYSRNGFRIVGHHLEFTGICPRCQEKRDRHGSVRGVLNEG